MTCWLDEKLLGFDLETTGVDPFSDVPVSFALVRFRDRAPVETIASLVDPGQPISPDAVAVHGITEECARAEGTPLPHAVETICDALIDASQRSVPVVGMNVSFDLTMIDATARRSSGRGLIERGFAAPVVDVLVLDRHFNKYRKGKRRLSDLCEHYGVTQENAHDAVGDVVTCLRVLLAMGVTYPEIGTTHPEILHRRQIGWHADWACGYSVWRAEQGQALLPLSAHYWPLHPVLAQGRSDVA